MNTQLSTRQLYDAALRDVAQYRSYAHWMKAQSESWYYGGSVDQCLDQMRDYWEMAHRALSRARTLKRRGF
jgi:hypothetical protein